MIRRATLDDLPAIVEMGGKFHAYSPWADVDYDPERAGEFIARVVLPQGAVFLSEDGMIGALLSPLYFNPAKVTAVELFWWAPTGDRGLRAALENWACAAGAFGVQFSALADSHSKAVGRLYRRAGFAPAETAYIKRF